MKNKSVTISEVTEVLYGSENAVGRGEQFMKNARKRMDLYFDKNGASIVVTHNVYKDNYIAARQRGCTIRLITEITQDNLHYCKELMAGVVDELRHLEGLIGGIAVNDSEYMGTTALEEKQLLTQVIYSNVKEIVEQGRYIFNTFWTKAIPAKQRIKEIEEGLKREFLEIIRDPDQIQKLIFDIITSANEEILISFPSPRPFILLENQGLLELVNEAVEQRGVKVRIIILCHNGYGSSSALVKNSISRKFIEEGKITLWSSQRSRAANKLIMLIADAGSSLVVDINEDGTKNAFRDLTGVAVYSNSKSTVLCNNSVFETLWIQTELQKEDIKNHSGSHSLGFRGKCRCN